MTSITCSSFLFLSSNRFAYRDFLFLPENDSKTEDCVEEECTDEDDVAVEDMVEKVSEGNKEEGGGEDEGEGRGKDSLEPP